MQFTGVKVFSATKARDREELGGIVTHWLAAHPEVCVMDTIVMQSSDSEFHCLTITLFYLSTMTCDDCQECIEAGAPHLTDALKLPWHEKCARGAIGSTVSHAKDRTGCAAIGCADPVRSDEHWVDGCLPTAHVWHRKCAGWALTR